MGVQRQISFLRLGKVGEVADLAVLEECLPILLVLAAVLVFLEE